MEIRFRGLGDTIVTSRGVIDRSNTSAGAAASTPDDEHAALLAIAAGTASEVGEKFFQSLAENLARACGVAYAFVTEFLAGGTRVRTLAFWAKDQLAENVEYDLAGTPCEDVLRGSLCHYPHDVIRRFPLDRDLVSLGAESYLGVPLSDASGKTLGHLAIVDEQPMPEEPRRLAIFRIFAARAAAELERLRMEAELEASEKRFRDLFDEAPIAYVFEDSNTRFVHANQAAMNLLGLTPEDIPHTVGMSLVAPDAKTSIDSAFSEIRQGHASELVELELRRKDDGRPVFVQFWSRPEPDGKHTRTMIIDITERVLAQREKARLARENEYLQEEIKAAQDFDEIIGRSPVLSTVLENVRCVGPTEASVLITGETGTGKELIARAVHSVSGRRDKPIIKVNCAALPSGLIESELFGHEKGAFTGAISRREGRFELADGGTIFLDEVGELPLDAQAKLLRVLQEREFDRLGGRAPIKVDVRVIAATNRDLSKCVAEKTFREDLFYRLNVFPIPLPPLRRRQEDIPLLAHYFAMKFAARLGKRLTGIGLATLARLKAYAWPGNIRELENVIERAVILCRIETLEIEASTLPESAAEIVPADLAPSSLESVYPDSLESLERKHIISVLEQTGWRVDGNRGAAQILGLHPNTLRSRIKKLGITRPE